MALARKQAKAQYRIRRKWDGEQKEAGGGEEAEAEAPPEHHAAGPKKRT
jgi:hypothetical protein